MIKTKYPNNNGLDINYFNFNHSKAVHKYHCSNPKCKYHKNEYFTLSESEHLYKINGAANSKLKFCSHTCREIFKREHAKLIKPTYQNGIDKSQKKFNYTN